MSWAVGFATHTRNHQEPRKREPHVHAVTMNSGTLDAWVEPMASPNVLRTCLFVLVMTGCGGRIADDSSFEPPPPNDDASTSVEAGTSPPPPPAPDPFHPGEDWLGTYTCPQGLTNLNLRIVSMQGDTIDDALFIFDCPGASGSYHMTGSFDRETSTATFVPTQWIVQPGPNWYTVGMAGTVRSGTYAGGITSASCGSFTVTE